MPFSNIMVDLETLDTRQSAVVASIGAVAFDPYAVGSSAIGDRFYVELTGDLMEQQRRGRTISADTVVWWMRQGQAAQQLFASPAPPGVERVDTHEALVRFALFIEANGGRDSEIWGNGADFDNVILGSLYEDFGIKRPWSYSRNRCFRTMKNISGVPHKTERFGVHHNALDDAITQVEHLQKINAHLREGK